MRSSISTISADLPKPRADSILRKDALRRWTHSHVLLARLRADDEQSLGPPGQVVLAETNLRYLVFGMVGPLDDPHAISKADLAKRWRAPGSMPRSTVSRERREGNGDTLTVEPARGWRPMRQSRVATGDGESVDGPAARKRS